MKVETNQAQATRVYGAIVRAYRLGHHPFNLPTTVTPQDEAHLPPGIKSNPEVYAYYLFCLCLFMTGMDSVTASKGLAKMYLYHPELFEHPSNVLVISRPKLARHLSNFGLSFSDRNAVHWQANSATLIKRWKGSVLTLVAELNGDYDESCRRMIRNKSRDVTKLQGFYGFQHKMVSMLLYYLMAEKLIPEFPHPIPVDFHILRLSVACEVIVRPDVKLPADYYSPQVLRATRAVTEQYQRDAGVGPVELCNALWLYGKAMCRYNPGNKSRVGLYAARRTAIEANHPVWNEKELKDWQRSCGSCAVQQLCMFDIPSSSYFIRGQLIALRPRSLPPHENSEVGLFNPHTLHH